MPPPRIHISIVHIPPLSSGFRQDCVRDEAAGSDRQCAVLRPSQCGGAEECAGDEDQE